MVKAFNTVVEGREFECYVSPIGYGMVSVSFYEVVNPTRKFFRTKWRDSGIFWIDDYDTIQSIVNNISYGGGSSQPTTTTYVVQSGDCLSSIGAKYGVLCNG